jgi:transposase-like protein
MIYMAITAGSKRSTKAIQNWKQALNHFAIMFEHQMPK